MALLNPYCTLLEVKNQLRRVTDATKDDIIEAAINRASRKIDTITRRTFYKKTLTDYYLSDHDYNVVIGTKIFLSNFPIITLTTLVEDGTTLTVNEDFYINESSGILTKADGADWITTPHAIKITGTFGYDSADNETPSDNLPGDIRQACIDIAKRYSGYFHKDLMDMEGETHEVYDESVPVGIAKELKEHYGRRLA